MFRGNKNNKKLTQFLKPYCQKTKKNIHYKATKIGSQFFLSFLGRKTQITSQTKTTLWK